MIEKMKLESQDVAAQRREELKQLFPSIFTETENDNGELVESIDFEKLKAEIGTFTDVFESRRERFGLDWPGKKDCMRIVQNKTHATLKPCKDESVDFDKTKNVFIEGDNLEVLKLLQKSYYGSVKVIYIDPPYNRGKDFIYPDNYAESLETYLEYANLVDSEGRKYSSNNPTEGRFHSKWLKMIYPRLYLARNLLRRDGVIFISIDEIEVAHLRRVCNEIFGEENFVAELVWEKTRKNDAKLFSLGHDYILCFAKDKNYLKELDTEWREAKPGAAEVYAKYLELKEAHGSDFVSMQTGLREWYKNLPNTHPAKKLSRYKHIDKNGPWRDRDISWPGGDGPRYDVIHPVTKKACKVPERGWGFATIESMNQLIDNDLIMFRDDHTKPPLLKAHLVPPNVDLDDATDDLEEEVDEAAGLQVMPSVIYKQSQVAIKYLRKLMGAKVFDNPKDHEVLARLINYVTDKGDLVLDFFAGSGSTGQAVYHLNQNSEKGLHFILVQLPEILDSKKKEQKAGFEFCQRNAFSPNIAELAKERLRRASKELVVSPQESLFDDPESVDLGFRVYRLDKSNFDAWQNLGPETDEKMLERQLELHIDHLDVTATEDEILTELLLKAGFELSVAIEEFSVAKKTVFSIADNSVLICLDDELNQELLDEVVRRDPIQFICLDKAFKGNDQLKANAVQTFAARNQGRDKADQIVFRTV